MKQFKILVLDTETATGFKPRNAQWCNDAEKLPKLAQVSWMQLLVTIYQDDINYKVLKTRDFIIKPNDRLGKYQIEEKNTEIHGITQEKAEEEGKEIVRVLRLLLHDTLNSDYIAGHNLFFDTENLLAASEINFVGSGGKTGQMYEALHKDKRICTMMSSIKYCKIPFANGRKGNKYPKLEELYYTLFNKQPNANLHNSLEDVKVTVDCFIELIKRRVLKYCIKIYDGAYFTGYSTGCFVWNLSRKDAYMFDNIFDLLIISKNIDMSYKIIIK
jgi:DNA polymerase III epsilon subunit-like protein